MTRRKRTLALLAAVLCLLTSVAQAAGSIDLTRKPTLTLTYRDGKTALSGAKFSIYRVADADETGELTVRSEFDEFDLDIRGKNDRRWREMAQTLESYVLRRELTPADSGKTDKTGMLTFPTQGKTLAAGLYLVIGERHTQGGTDYDAEPFFVLLPTQDKHFAQRPCAGRVLILCYTAVQAPVHKLRLGERHPAHRAPKTNPNVSRDRHCRAHTHPYRQLRRVSSRYRW